MMIVLIPGLMCDGAVFAGQIAGLSRLGPVLVACNDGCATLGAMAERILDSTSGELAVIGHSMGGRVALELYARAPERVKRLGLLDTGVHPMRERERERAGRERLVDLARAQGMGVMVREWMPGMVAPANLTRMSGAIEQMALRCPVEAFAAQQQALLSRPDRTALLSEIRCPTLCVTGEFDGWSPPEQHRAMAAAIQDGRFASIQGAGHMAPMEKPEALADELVKLISC